MTIRESLNFSYNGQDSQEFGIINVNMQTGMQSEQFVSGRSIKEQRTRGRDRGHFQEIELQPLEFTVSFAFENAWDFDSKRAVARWLFSPKYYSPMVFSNDPDVIYYCVCVDSPELIHNNLSQGYINLKFVCDGAYKYSSVYQSSIYDYSSNVVAGAAYTFENYGDIECKPIIKIQKIGTGNVEIINTSNGGKNLLMTGLANLENVIIDCESETIETDLPLTSRYNAHNGTFLTMVTGFNYLIVKGNCKIQWKEQFKLL